MIRNLIWCFFIVVISIAILLAVGESWILLGDRDGNKMVRFVDGQTHGVTWWWFIKDGADKLLVFDYLFFSGLIFAKTTHILYHYELFELSDLFNQLANLFFILACYYLADFLFWSYDYSTNRKAFYIVYTSMAVWIGYNMWRWKPWKKNTKIIKM